MSDYFGALMRSSGLSVGGRGLALTAPVPAVVALEPAAPPAAAAMRPERLPQVPPALEAREASEAGHSTGFEPTPMLLAEDGVRPGPEREAPIGVTNEPAPGEMPGVISRSSVPAPSSTSPEPEASPIRAALRWIAADPAPALRLTPARAAPVVDTEPRAMDAIADEEPSVTATLEPARPAPEGTPQRAVLAATPASAVPSGQGPSPATAAPLQDEAVEISIGAIHLRVDAPQTVARPPAAPRAPALRAPALPARSALSRRALPRI